MPIRNIRDLMLPSSIRVDMKQKTLGFKVADCSSSSTTFTPPVHELEVDLDTMSQLETSAVATPKINEVPSVDESLCSSEDNSQTPIISFVSNDEVDSRKIADNVDLTSCMAIVNVSSIEEVIDKQISRSNVDNDEPVRPILDIYAPKTFSHESWSRDFQASWYKKYTWLDFSLDDSCGFCYACYKYGNGEFQFRNWKKSEN